MSREATISRKALSAIDCPIQENALSCWIELGGLSDSEFGPYAKLVPHLQIMRDCGREGPPPFIYVGDQSATAKVLGPYFSTFYQGGGWHDDGGYGDAVSGIFSEISDVQKPALESIKARVLMPNGKPIGLIYDRLSLPTSFPDGLRTFTIVATLRTILRAV